jgi:hypothetical protein
MRFDRFSQLMALMWVAATLGGCGSAQVAEPLTETTAGNDVESQMNFWHTLATRNITSNDEAFHALLLFFDGENPAEDYDERVELFKSRGWLPSGFNEPANQAVTRGTLARVLVEGLDIKGGLTMRIAGSMPRYALREMTYLRIFPSGSPNQTISGNQLLTVIGKSEDYQVLRAAKAASGEQPPASQQPGPAKPQSEAGSGQL